GWQVEPDDVAWIARQQSAMLLRADHVVRRRYDRRGVADHVAGVPQRAKWVDRRHGPESYDRPRCRPGGRNRVARTAVRSIRWHSRARRRGTLDAAAGSGGTGVTMLPEAQPGEVWQRDLEVGTDQVVVLYVPPDTGGELDPEVIYGHVAADATKRD